MKYHRRLSLKRDPHEASIVAATTVGRMSGSVACNVLQGLVKDVVNCDKGYHGYWCCYFEEETFIKIHRQEFHCDCFQYEDGGSALYGIWLA